MDIDNTAPKCTDDAAIAARIRSYTPTVLDEHLWVRHCADIRAAVVSAEPYSVEDAKSLLVVTCKYIAWLDRNGLRPGPLREILTEESIAAFAANVRASSTTKTAENQLGRLRRMHRRLGGISDPPLPAPRRPRSAPYSDAEVAALQALGQPTVTAAVDLALRFGVVVPGAYDHSSGYDRRSWDHARKTARSYGLALESTRLRATWARQQSDRATPAAELARSGLTSPELNAIARAATPVTVEQLALAR